MARTVRDAALLLAAMAGPDARDPVTAAGAGKFPADVAPALDANGLKGARIGVLRGSFVGYSPLSDRVFDAALVKMKARGAEIVDPVELPNAGKYDASELDVLLYEFKADVNAYLASRRGLGVKTLAGLIAFNEKYSDREMPYFGQDLFLAAEKKGPLTDSVYTAALAKNLRLSRAEGIDLALKTHRLELDARGRGGISEHHGASRRRLRVAGGRELHRYRVGRADADPTRVRVRAGHASPQAAAAGAHGEARSACRAEGEVAVSRSRDLRLDSSGSRKARRRANLVCRGSLSRGCHCRRHPCFRIHLLEFSFRIPLWRIPPWPMCGRCV
jgi:hypothetical protein